MAMKASTAEIFKYIQAHNDEDLTAEQIADALGYDTRKVNGTISMVICKQRFGEREEVLVKDEEGVTKTIKIIKLNEDGMAFDVDANAAVAE